MATAVQQYQYPSLREINEIDAALLARLAADSVAFRLFPLTPTPAYEVSWRQRDNFLGLQQIRGLNAKFPSVKRVASNEYSKKPSAFGEMTAILEDELTKRAVPGRPDIAVPVDDLVMEADEMLLTRQFNRQEWLIWQLLIYGTYAVLNETGTVMDVDSYNPILYTAPIPWTTVATAIPLGDLRYARRLGRGSSVSFGSDATMLMSQYTFDVMVGNQNAADLGGRKDGFDSVVGLDAVNRVMAKDGLPQIEIYDDGYYTDATTPVWTQWIPDGYVAIVGRRRNGAQLGRFYLTRNVNNPGNSSQPFVRVRDVGQGTQDEPPRRIEVYRGFNGGLGIWYPGSVVILKVF